MYRHYTLLQFVTACVVLSGTQVRAVFYDALDPTRLEVEEWHQRDPRVAIKNGEVKDLGCEKPNVYICEEPDNVILESTKMCNYRSVRYHEQVYKWVAGRGCLLYTPDFLYRSGYNNISLNAACLFGGLWAPCLEMAKEDGTCGCYPFDPALEEVANTVRQALIPAAHGRWERCFYAASDCCSHHMPDNVTDSNHCETTFDGWTCWDQAEADTIATEVCSEFAYSNIGPSCHHYSTKQCHHNGSWELQTDYSTCSITPRLLRRYRFHIAVLSISIAACLPAVFIFFFYKRLRVPRVSLHRNLLIVIIIRNILVIVSRSAIYIDEITNAEDTVMGNHGFWCRVLATAERIAANCVFVAMLVEGIYLHRTIVAVFRKKLKVAWLYSIGAVIAFIPVLIWAIVMGVLNDHSCWLVYTVEHIQWILDAPRIAILLINSVLFIDVLRVLLTKIRNSENANQLSTTKATLFLMPIFGTQFLLTAFRPSTTDCVGEQIYYYAFYTIEGLQGFIVAMLYCYVNKEVHALIKATYRKTENAVASRIRNDSRSSYPRTSTGNSDRRLTCSTGVPSIQEEEKDSFSTRKPNHHEHEKDSFPTKPNLHVAEIISIQASERLAEILEPVYETITGHVNEGYVKDVSDDGSSNLNRCSRDDYYAFTNASSVSIECQDWIRCVSSPSSSIYDNSLNDYETRYLERKFPNHPKFHEFNQARERKLEKEKAEFESNAQNDVASKMDVKPTDVKIEDSHKTASTSYDNRDMIEEEEVPGLETVLESGIEDSQMLDEIIQYMEKNEFQDNRASVVLKPELLSPNRKEEDAIVFVDIDIHHQQQKHE